MTGDTWSWDFPTQNPYQGIKAGGYDVFVTKISCEIDQNPLISSINPNSGSVGTEVAISGSNFGTSEGTVTFNGVDAAITSWSDTQIETTVPSDATTGPVVVHTSDGKDSNGVTFTFVEDRQYTLVIDVASGGTSDPSPGNYIYDSGTEVSVTAIPDANYIFSEWTGDVPSGQEEDNPITITMDSDKSITANFILQYTLTIVAGTGGTTNPTPGSHTYDSGAQVSITATPSSGYQFSGWSGDASGTSNPTTITMDSDKSVTASFSATDSSGGGGSSAGDSDGGGMCFIATATYGSPLHPHVKTLRDFRDKYLMSSKAGRILVNLYYKYSPFVANLIAKNKALKVIVRNQLVPFVALSYMAVHLGSVVTTIMFFLIFAISIFSVSFYRRKLI